MPARAARTFAAVLLTFAATVAWAWADTPQTVQFTILHTNDTHGHLLPFSYPETFDPGSKIAMLRVRRNVGGIARRSTLVKQVRAEKDRQVLLVDAGDVCDGTPFSTEFHGDADIAAMNAAGYDMACPGNHEMNNTLPQVRQMMTDARFPYLCANLVTRNGTQPVYKPYTIKQVGTARVAFFGLLTTDARTYPACKTDLTVETPVDVARKLVPELHKQADFVVLLSHLGVDEDRQLAASVDGIDAIVGGHSHTLLQNPIFIGCVPTGVPFSVNGTVIVQDFQWGTCLGRLDLTLNRSETGRWTVQRYAGRLLPITAGTAEDPAVAAVVGFYWKRISAKYGEVLGTATDDFTKKGPDYAHYNLVADAVHEATHSDFDLENRGGVRSPIVKGPVTYGDLVTADPFGNTIWTFRATGSQVKEMLLRTRPAASGLAYEIRDGQLVKATIGGQPIDDARVYSGSTNSFFATTLLRDVTDKADTGKGRLDALLAYVRAHKTISPAYDGRRIVTGVADSFDE